MHSVSQIGTVVCHQKTAKSVQNDDIVSTYTSYHLIPAEAEIMTWDDIGSGSDNRLELFTNTTRNADGLRLL